MPNKDKEVCFVKFTKGSLNRIVHIFVRVIHSKNFASYSASRGHTCYSNYKKKITFEIKEADKDCQHTVLFANSILYVATYSLEF